MNEFLTTPPGIAVLIASVWMVITLKVCLWILLFRRIRRRWPSPTTPAIKKEFRVVDESGGDMPDGPLRRAIQRSWETGEPVVWNEGDPLP